MLLLPVREPIVKVVPLAVTTDEGGGDEVSLGGNDEVALRRRKDLPLPYQHVQCVTQDLGTWRGYTWEAGGEVLHQSVVGDGFVGGVHSGDGQTQDLPQWDELGLADRRHADGGHITYTFDVKSCRWFQGPSRPCFSEHLKVILLSLDQQYMFINPAEKE